jgi:hypothetical protein
MTKCLVAKEHFGYTTYINICSDTEKVIPWTTGDWFGFTLALSMLVLVVLATGAIGYMVKDLMR